MAVATSSGGGHSSTSMTVLFGKRAVINGRSFQPVAIVEDSRCPPTANCIWAGRLVVDVRHGRDTIRMEMGKPVAVAGGRLTIVDASPQPMAGKKSPPRAYRFPMRFERP